MTAGLVTGLAAEARLARRLGLVMAGGGTSAGAAAAAGALLEQGAVCLISFGLAGGLDPALRAGDIVVPAIVLDGGERLPADRGLLCRLGGPTCDVLVAASLIIATVAEKSALRAATGAAAVDMESGAVARVARDAAIPFAVVRAVCDPARRGLPPAALLALDQAGSIGLRRVLGSLAARPGQLSALLALARDAARARQALVGRVDRLLADGGLVG